MTPAILLLSAALAQDTGDAGTEGGEQSAPTDSGEQPAPTDQSAEESAREADMFSAPVEAPAEAPPAETSGDAPAGRDDAMLGNPLTTNTQIDNRLDTADKALTLGGKLTLRPVVGLPDGGGFEDVTLDSPNLLDVFLDARPDDRTRAYISGRLYHDWSVNDGDLSAYGTELTQTSVSLDQLWVKFDVAHRVYVTAGKQRIKWGTGRFWNPTDFMNQQARDPLAVFDTRTGVSLLKVHVPVGSTVNLYGIANVEGASKLDEVGGAARAEAAFGTSEASLSVAARKDQPLRLGADLSTAVWLFDLKVEGAVLHGDPSSYWEGTFDIDTFTTPTEVSRKDDWIPQVVGSAEITFKIGDDDTLSLGGEYFYNDAGYDDPDLYAWLLLNGQYTPFYVGRQYAGAYLLLPAPGKLDDHTFSLSALSNLSDQTAVIRLQHAWSALSWLNITSYAAVYLGDQGELFYHLSVPAISGVEGLENGIEVVPKRAEVGVWASVRF